ncbi:hypothetical protein IE53DRAFT_362164 [Violaceomyces palustris]|uniref:Uncharacterized protein n=1 Tax=Violaceomyces palustris TaxID=1673888 RepID=A0ACD0NY98_9BASI|nr:hypothetical protein IE53DRAFT_362164 [Violaceomyces palustris]
MASNDDTDDLYADLYGGDSGNQTSSDPQANLPSSDEPDLIGYEDDVQIQTESNNAAGSSSNSFIPPMKKPASTTSFIPAAPPTSNSHGYSNSGNDNNNNDGNFDNSDQKPKLNYKDLGSRQERQSHLHDDHTDAGEGRKEQTQSQPSHYPSHESGQSQILPPSDNPSRPVMPHEMPEEGGWMEKRCNFRRTSASLDSL